MYKNNDKVTDGKEQSSSFIEPVYELIHYSTKSCVYRKSTNIHIQQLIKDWKGTTDSSCALVQLYNFEIIVIQKSKRSSLMKMSPNIDTDRQLR